MTRDGLTEDQTPELSPGVKRQPRGELGQSEAEGDWWSIPLSCCSKCGCQIELEGPADDRLVVGLQGELSETCNNLTEDVYMC